MNLMDIFATEISQSQKDETQTIPLHEVASKVVKLSEFPSVLIKGWLGLHLSFPRAQVQFLTNSLVTCWGTKTHKLHGMGK